MAGYQYDVFISYPRRGGITAWVRQVLEPLLREKLAENLPHGEAVSIFLDTAMEIGSRWPDTLAEAGGQTLGRAPGGETPWFEHQDPVPAGSLLRQALQQGQGHAGGFPRPRWRLQQHGGSGLKGCRDRREMAIDRQGIGRV